MMKSMCLRVLLMCYIWTTLSANVSGEIEDIIPEDVKETTELPNSDIERQLEDIFVVNFIPKLTSTPPKFSDQFNIVNENLNVKSGTLIRLGRRSDFRVRRNCPCIVNGHCAQSQSC